MILIFIISFLSLIGLMVLHEFGHFILAKIFGIKVEEFGLGYPPKIFGRKFGETLYSLNLLPFGAFVRIYGESERKDDPRSFSGKAFWKRALVILGGVVSFWIIAIILFSVVMGLGVPTIINDEENHNHDLVDPKVQITLVVPGSPADQAGIKVGDAVLNVKTQVSDVKTIDKVKEFQEIIAAHKGEEIFLTIKRGKNEINTSLTPRLSPPASEGPIGVALVRTALKAYPWYLAPIEGTKATINLTITVVEGWTKALVNLIRNKPTGVQLIGPVGIFGLFTQVGQLGAVYFLQFIGIISIFVALSNILPLPITDGGKLLFLLIEKIRRKPIREKIEQSISGVCFFILIVLMILVTIRDIKTFF